MIDDKFKKTIREEFNKSALAAHKAFPNRLKNLIILSTEHPIFISPEVASLLPANSPALKRLINKKAGILKNKNYAAIALNGYTLHSKFYFSQKQVKIIALDIATPHLDIYPKYTRKMNLNVNLDHEIGHLVTKNGLPATPLTGHKHLAECCADAYAAIRHIQRYGENTDFKEAYNRSYNIVLGTSPIHYTNTVVSKIVKLGKRMDLSKLSLKEVATLSDALAHKYSLDGSTLKRISNAFAPTARMHREKAKLQDIAKKCAEIILNNKHDHDVYRTGRAFLNRSDIKIMMHLKYMSDPTWKKLINEMKIFEASSRITLCPADAIDIKKHGPQANRPKNNKFKGFS